MNTQTLPRQAIDRLFDRLYSIYGNQFTAKFGRVVDGKDVGIEMAKVGWAEELGGFSGNLDAIAYGLKILPSDFPPNAVQFAELCRKAPKEENALPAIAYDYNEEKAKAFAANLAKIVGSAGRGSDPVFWATHPKSELAFEFIRGSALNDPNRFQPCIDHLIAAGRVSDDGKKLLQKYAGNGEWVKA